MVLKQQATKGYKLSYFLGVRREIITFFFYLILLVYPTYEDCGTL